MNIKYKESLAELRREIGAGGRNVAAIDAIVRKMLSNGDRDIAADLLGSLSDHAVRDEGMFSLIHAAESADDRSYVSALCGVYPKLVDEAPRWASIVLMRVLNNDSTQHELVSQLREASDEVKAAFREMSERINSVSPEFLGKTTPVLLASMR